MGASALSKLSILEQSDLKRVPVEVAEWGGTVYIRELTAGEMDAWEQYCVDLRQRRLKDAIPNLRAHLLVRCICDEHGNRLFEDGDAAALGGKSSTALQVLFDAAVELNKMSAEAVEAVEKN